MLVKNKRQFATGLVFTVSFFVVLFMIFSPIWGGKNGLEMADDMFNKLSKGSSYFIPKVSKSVEAFIGTPIVDTIKLESPDDAEKTSILFSKAGAKTTLNGRELIIEGDLGVILQAVLRDSDEMYHNNGRFVSERYGYDEKKVMKSWWTALGKIEKNLKKEKKVAEAKVVSDVMKKAVEPAYNFYQIDAEKVTDKAGIMSGLLVFYVLYTMWWGFSIFYLFEGFGLSMKKAKVKKEV